MLDTDTRRRIDTARDILVGKVPDPKSQVEQITIALIYKFMDDMDAESEELGGVRTFFAGEFERYGWTRLMAPGIGGHETLNLYGEAIAKMPENPGIPALFRDIFKNAYLPYRDPETLRAFLKVIDDFSYDHSERLGDAFEYLLSVLGSQGDAGQFRTPRHIIDFMVAVIAPQKDERILDPACGTAGFLISAWKHILAANERDGRPGGALTPDERARLMDNVRGYDISPDMVRLSLVNLYLHGFNDPHVYEYDTLTSDDKWNEYYNVILANPPFMSPKGGIRPHKRFSVSSNRSEVLFVDYIAEHLLPNGRAAVIVPEGVIFQNGSAYKKLRELLINDFLVGVISLPSGVFQPYTAVKTSILVFDKAVAKTNPNILFSDVRHIGMSLGIKRIPSELNDLPNVIEDFRVYYSGGEFSDSSWVAQRKVILANDSNLTGERYRPHIETGTTRYTKLGDVCTLTKGKSSSTETEPGQYPLIVRREEWLTSSEYQFESEAVCIPLLSLMHGRGVINRIHYATGKFALANLLAAVQSNDANELNTKFLYLLLDAKKEEIADLMQGAIYVTLKIKDLAEYRIPLPPLAEQEAIVAEVESYQRIVDGARQVVENWRPRIEIDPEWEGVELGEVCRINNETADPSALFGCGEFTYIDISSVRNGTGEVSFENSINAQNAPSRARRVINNEDILLSTVRPNLKAFAYLENIPPKAIASTGFAVLTAGQSLVSKYLFYILNEDVTVAQMIKRMGKGSYPSINQKDVSEIVIPLPPIIVQDSLVAQIEQERALIQSNRDLITRFEQKIRDRIARVWGEG